MEHIPVLVKEIVKNFDNIKYQKKTICDFTVGGGGHSFELLSQFPNIEIIAFDKDSFAIEKSKAKLSKFGKRIKFIKSDFSCFEKFIETSVDGAILDLGISSFQIDDKTRGFSFNSLEPLDMRMDKDQELTAYHVVNFYDFITLQRIFKEYGEIRMPNKVIKAIISYREIKKIDTCKELADIIEKKIHRKGKIHPATKYFQAIRIEVNQELESLKIFLKKIFNFLNFGAKLQIISFHSLEDRIVKQCFRETVYNDNSYKIITKKPIVPSDEEKVTNPRSRSAKLRVIERTERKKIVE